jgi:CRP-like cAMP-binding protein
MNRAEMPFASAHGAAGTAVQPTTCTAESTMAAAADHDQSILLKNLVPLNALSDDHLGQLISRASIERIQQGRFLFREGDTDHQHVYLLEGKVSLLSGNREVDVVHSGTNTARFALAHQWPRKFSARTLCDVRVVRIDSRVLSDLLVRTQSQSYRVTELESEGDEDWMSLVLRSRVFKLMPASNIQNVLRRMERVEATAGEVIIRQGEPGDFYYVLVQGSCTVSRSDGDQEVEIARLVSGDGFGEDALVSGEPRRGTVTMTSEGALMRLGKKDFVELIQRPIIHAIEPTEAQAEMERGSICLDIRSAEAFARGHNSGAVNVPLDALRERMGTLDPDREYLVCAEEESIAAVGAFLLRERGLDAVILKDGGLGKLQAKAGPDTSGDSPSGRGSGADDGGGVEDGESGDLQQLLRDTQARFHRALYQRVAEIRQLRQSLLNAKAAKQRLEQDLEKARTDNASLRQALVDVKAELASRPAGTDGPNSGPEVELLQRRLVELQQELDEVQEVLQEASAEESAHQWEMVRLRTRVEGLELDLKEQQELNRVLREENEETLKRLASMKKEAGRPNPDVLESAG